MTDTKSHRTAVTAWAAIAASLLGFGLALGEDPAGFPPVPPAPDEINASPVTPTVAIEPIPLSGDAQRPPSATRRVRTGSFSEWTVLAAIASTFVVLAAFRYQQTRRRSREVPADVFDVLGEVSLGGQHGVRIVRFGPRTLLVGISAAGCQTLATLDDPLATDRIVAACAGSRSARPPSAAASVRRRPEPEGSGTP